MAVGREKHEKFALKYGLVSNIPADYHSSDLRNYFSQFIESGGFQCFHYRHRPQKKTPGIGEAKLPIVESLEGVSQSRNPEARGQRRDHAHGSQLSCSKNGPHDANGVGTSSGNAVSKSKDTKCCVIRLKECLLEKFIKMYNRRHWLDKNGESIAQVCLISKVTVSQSQPNLDVDNDILEDGDSAGKAIGYKTRFEQRQVPKDREQFTEDDLRNLLELRPPDIMPNGNVGTPTKFFMDKIRECKLPPTVIKKLGLKFPKMRSRRNYGSVPFDYGNEVIDVEEESVYTADGHELEIDPKPIRKKSCREETTGSSHSQGADIVGQEEPDSGSDNDTCEEWERHEALYDDPDNQERNKERLFEDKIELKWEKGGSGLVFYTDANFWQQQEGDFDEQTADDWDVDMSEYYEPGSGDMDAKALVVMDRERRRRAGIADPEDRVFKGKIGKFEMFTKGIGRKVLEKQGWKDGEGLGSTITGIADALENEGQAPSCKSGFGYHGEKLNRYPVKRPRPEREVFIPTVYDKPEELDQPETLLRRKTHYAIKYRDNIKFTKGSEEQS